MQLFDNVAYYAITKEDTIIPCRKGADGPYHVDGNLLLPPPEMLESSYIRNCTLLMAELADTPQIVLSSLPRYLTARCCGEAEHASNKLEEGFRRKLISGAERLR
jgi:hypothetical protein